METLADRLRRAMSVAGMNQKELAKACGVKPPSVNGWLSEKAKFLRGENLLKAAKALGVSQDWLATGKGDMAASIKGESVPPQSNPVRLDRTIVETVAEALSQIMLRRGARLDLTDTYQSEMFCEVYAELSAMRDGTSPMAASAVVADIFAASEVRRRERERSVNTGGVDGKKDRR